MSNRKKLMHEDENLRVVYQRRDGRRRPARVHVMLPALPGTDSERYLSLTIDELFDLTEVLDDTCDYIEDQIELQKTIFRPK